MSTPWKVSFYSGRVETTADVYILLDCYLDHIERLYTPASWPNSGHSLEYYVYVFEGDSSAIAPWVEPTYWKDNGEADDFYFYSSIGNDAVWRKTRHILYRNRQFNIIAHYEADEPPSLSPCGDKELLGASYDIIGGQRCHH